MQVMLWKYDGGGQTSYISKAGKNNRHFDLGDDINKIKEMNGFTDNDMFNLLNEPFLDVGLIGVNDLTTLHDPTKYGGALKRIGLFA